MALRKPLVLGSDGLQEQLQAGDTLDAVSDGAQQASWVNGNAGTLAPGTPVYIDGPDDVDKAKADAGATAKCVGLAAASIGTGVAGPITIDGVLALTTGQWDTAFGTTGGLTAGTYYFLSPSTAGKGQVAVPATVGQYVVLLGMAVSTTELLVRPRDPIAL